MSGPGTAAVRESWVQFARSFGDRYLLRGWLGSGAFGDVFHAEQANTGQDVAIKVLRIREDERSARRFKQEIRACGALHHPHIVRVLDAGGGEGDAPLYIAFEYLPGETLAQWLAREGTMRVQDALNCMTEVLDALHAAHRAGIVHRDLKPANIMISTTARGLTPKVLDFGVASLLDQTGGALGGRLTHTDDRIGTPAYCAPEQLRGDPPSPSADIYAWGLVLLECLTGKPVFAHESLPGLLHAQFAADPVPLPAALVGHRFGDLLRWTLEKDPSRRAADAHQVIQQFGRLDLHAIVDGSGFLLTPSAVSAPTQISPLSLPRGERRAVTALCCRLTLPNELDREHEEAFDEWTCDLCDVVSDVAARMGGVLCGSAGSELVVYFGLDSRDGQVTARAARAALELRDVFTRRSNLMQARSGWNVEIRLGMHLGMLTIPVERASSPPTIASLSMAVSQLAERCGPGEIAVSPLVCDALRGSMYLAPGDAGNESSGASSWFRLLGGPVPSGKSEPSCIFGREVELAALDASWVGAKLRGHARTAVIGPAGIGKSHLVTVWTARLAGLGVRILPCRCLPELQGVALHPILQLLREELGLSDMSGVAASELEGFVGQLQVDPSVGVSLLGAALGLSAPHWSQLAVSPKKRRDMLLGLLREVVVHLAGGPAVLLIEDIQWADPTTLEWVSALPDSSSSAPLMLLFTARAGESLGFEAHEPSLPALRKRFEELLRAELTTVLQLEPLSAEASRSLIASAWKIGPNEQDLQTLAERGAGVPLFLLELARARGASEEFVPVPIAELLTARIHELREATEVAQLAAVAAPECSYALLEELSQRGHNLLGDLNQLHAAGILTAKHDNYVFTHALLRDSAYHSIPRADRRRLHRAVAACLKRGHPELVEQRPWTFALHHYRGSELEEALAYGESTVSGALMRFENVEALAYVRQLKGAIESDDTAGWLDELEHSPARAEIELRLMALEATALSMTLGWTDHHLDRLCRRATALFEFVPPASTVPLRWAIVQFYVNRGLSKDEDGRDPVKALLATLLRVAEEAGAHAYVRLSRMVSGAWQLFHGEIEASIETLARIDPSTVADDAWKYGLDAHAIGQSIQALARWYRGDTQAREASLAALAMTAERKHPGTRVLAMLYHASLLHLQRDREAARAVCRELLEVCDRLGIQGYPGYAVIILGWSESQPAAPAEAIAALCAAGQRLTEGYYGAIVAETELDAGLVDAAHARLKQLRALVEASGEVFCLPDILFQQARCAALQGAPVHDIDALVVSALESAINQGAFGMATSLARRYREEERARRILNVPGSERLRRLLHEADLLASDAPISTVHVHGLGEGGSVPSQERANGLRGKAMPR